MANVTITRTQQGYIKIDLGDYYPGTTDEGAHYFPYASWGGLCTITIDGEEGVEFHITHESSPLLICVGTKAGFFTVDSVGGVSPVSTENLIELILDLVQ